MKRLALASTVFVLALFPAFALADITVPCDQQQLCVAEAQINADGAKNFVSEIGFTQPRVSIKEQDNGTRVVYLATSEGGFTQTFIDADGNETPNEDLHNMNTSVSWDGVDAPVTARVENDRNHDVVVRVKVTEQ